VDTVDGWGQTALHHATACIARNDENTAAAAATAQLLLQRGACIDARDHDGETPLHGATYGWRLAAMRLLLDHGAQVDARNYQGRTPLMFLFKGTGGSVNPSAAEAVQLLAGRGADANAVDEDGLSPLSHACSHTGTDGDTVRALLAAGARVERESGTVLIDALIAAAAGAQEPPSVGAIVALIGAGAGACFRNARALAEAAAGFVDAADPEEAQAFIEAYPCVLAAAERALDEDVDARVAARLAAAVEADRRDVASGLRALITGAAAEARRLEAARAASAEERRAAAAEREALARERLAAAVERAEPPLEAPNGSGGCEAKPLTKRARHG
jgi:hypothetical protein